ncbi:AgmX/PglI C-terminal domain-containing protein [Archangium lansingense]|uniref:AgmX/PglI C-terminal domain-containing protein n=1 Tax=Archangium lansingense TaxID=2995310 RepID=UPI003B7FF83B
MRGRAVFLWVVIPFVALSALALWLTRDTPAPAVAVDVPASPAPEPPSPAPSPEVPAERTPPAAPPPPAPPAPPEDEPRLELPPGTWTEEEVRVALQSVQPLVRTCLADASVRHPGPQTVKLRFTLEARGEHGRFQGSEVVENTLQDPFVDACLLDALADAQFSAPPGKAPVILTHPFHFRPGKRGDP